MKVALRDDDTSYFTEPGRLEARLSRRVGSPSGRPRGGAARGGLRRQGDSREVLARRPRLSARRESGAGRIAAQAGQGRPRDDRAARLHARGLSRRPRVPGRAGSREPPRARPGVSRARARHAHPRVRAAAQRVVEARTARRSSAAGLNLLGSFLSFRPSMRPWDLRTPGNWWRVKQYRDSDQPHEEPIASSIRTCCATAITRSSAATA